jgi:G3E family GTPase
VTIPITVLTGFLGAGKTTLLNAAVQRPALRRALVVVNELGEIGIDHLLVREASEDLLLLESGCVCCSLRGDLVDVLTRASAGERGTYDRVLLETTGLADPTPILATIHRHPALAEAYHLDATVTAVDAELALRTLRDHDEAVKQVALADDVVLTKCDRVDASRVERVRSAVAGLNPSARWLTSSRGDLDWDSLLGWSASTVRARLEPDAHHAPHARGAVHTVSVRADRDVDFRTFALWLSMVAQLRGEKLLRLKGLLRVEDEPGPLVVQSVQHVVYPVYTMPAWPSGDRTTRVVALTRGMAPEHVAELRASLERVLGAA